MDAPRLKRPVSAVGQDGRMDTKSRLIPLQGSFNFRDLGGYPGSRGRLTRWGRLYRADALHELTAADVGQLRQLGLRTIVDLRTERELARSGRGPLEPEDVAFHHLAVVREAVRGDGTSDRAGEGEAVAAPAPAGDDLAERYLWYLDVGRDSLVETLTLLGGDEHYPLVFHCAAGKDRTGVLAALVLSILGVERQVIVADYVITAERLRFIMQRWLADPEFAERMAKVPATRFSVEAPTMEGFLDQLQDRYGGARQWALDAGVSAAVLDRIADLLLEPGAG
jgi:protein-tyrosine phosphatase